MREKEKKTKQYPELLVHYHAKLAKSGKSITVVTQKTGAVLPLQPEGKLRMVTLLLSEFGSVETINQGIDRYRASRSWAKPS
jgi:hypothetical protein